MTKRNRKPEHRITVHEQHDNDCNHILSCTNITHTHSLQRLQAIILASVAYLLLSMLMPTRTFAFSWKDSHLRTQQLCTRIITQPTLAARRTMKSFKTPSLNVHISPDSYPHGLSYVCKCNQSKPNISKQRHSMRQWWQSEETLGNRFWHQDIFLDVFSCLWSMRPSKFNQEPSCLCRISRVLGLLPMC